MSADGLGALGLDWEIGDDDDTLVCPVTWHGEAGALVLERGRPGPAMLSLVGAKGVIWTRPLEAPGAR